MNLAVLEIAHGSYLVGIVGVLVGEQAHVFADGMCAFVPESDRTTVIVFVIIQSVLQGEEAEGMGQYDYILVNDTVEECVDHLHQIIVSEHSRASRNAEFIADIQKQTKAFQK